MTSSYFSIRVLILAVTFFSFTGSQISAQPSLDLSFNASLTRVPIGDVRAIFPQPDGKIFVTGAFKAASGKSRSSVARLNANGSVDDSFYGPEIRSNEPFSPARVFDLALQSTGKVLVAGEFNWVDGQTMYRLIRLNADGSLDNTFAPQPISWVVQDILVLPDDKIMVGGGFQYADPSGPRNQLVRLNADGTLDTSIAFSPEPDINVSKIIRQPDGKLVVAYGSKVVRYTTTGALDPTFGSIVANQPIFALVQQPDGRLVMGGDFTTVNGFSLVRIFRTNADGAIDGTFSTETPNDDVLSIDVAPDGRIAVGGRFTLYGTTARKRSAVLDANGNLSNTYVPSTNPILTVYATVFQADGRVLIGGEGNEFNANPMLVRVNADGAIDSGFNALIGFNGVGGRIRVQPDGKILVSGQFTNSNLVDRFGITRFNADGTLDTGFTPPSSVASATILTGLDLLSDGKLVTVGMASDGFFQAGLQLNANGTLFRELSIDQRPRDVRALPNDQFLIGAGSHLRRYNTNGTIDGTFNPTIVGDIYRVVLQPDGKILIGGSFTQVSGNTRSGIARLNSDGSIDPTFNPPGGANGVVDDVVLQAEGKLKVAGEFTGINFDTNRKYLARLNSDGSLDAGYAPVVNAPVYALKLQPDGRLLIGGDMTLVNGVERMRFARLNANGSLEPTFNISVNETIRTIELQADGKIVYGGEFTRTNGISTLGIGRLLNPAIPTITRTPFDFDGDGRADVSVFRPSTNRWYEALSSGPVVEETFGTAGDIITPADFDGDGKTDEAVFRPSSGQWWYKSSIDGAQVLNTFGANGDIPRPSDFDGDGKADLVLFRPSNSTWYRFGSASGNVPNQQFGIAGDQPLVGDFDGDGKSDLAIFRPSNGDWWYAATSAGGAFVNAHWGQNGDIPVPADYDGDGRTDFAIFRPSDGGWYIYNSGSGSITTTAFGVSTDRPVAADYDGDGRADIAVFRPSTGIWYLLRSTSGFAGYQFGISTDIAVPGSLIP
jgi:uncharacterized delta-60 repeat protein